MAATCRFSITDGLRCAGCVARLERELAGEAGVAAVRASLVERSASVAFDPAATTPAALVAAFARHGFAAVPLADDDDGAAAAAQRLAGARRDALMAAALCIPLLLVAMGPDTGLGDRGRQGAAGLLAALVLLGPGRRLMAAGLAGLLRLRPAMDSLVALSALTAWGVSLVLALRGAHHTWFESAGMTVALVLAGRWIEERARHATGAAVRALLARQPPTALRLEADGEREVPVALVLPGDRLRLRAGLAVPCDAQVEEGAVEVDESAFTGEPLPALRAAGAAVAAGTVVAGGTAVVRATAVGAATALARTAAAVRAAQDARPPLARLADRLARVFTPAVLALAALAGAAWWLAGAGADQAAIAAASVLAVACPCALGLAIPTAIAVAAGRAAAAGIWLRDGAALETAARLDAVVLDKTGTLTAGRPALAGSDGDAAALPLAAAAARGSSHPLARALVAADPVPAAARTVAGFAQHPGAGLEATVDGRAVLLGSAAFLAGRGAAIPAALPPLAEEHSEAHLAVDGAWRARFAFADPLRPGAAAAVAALRALGCRVEIASGDRAPAVAAAARAAGVDAHHAACRDGDKRALVERLRGAGRTVAMVGDGVNDAQALAAADLGVALGTGTEVAVAAGTVVLPGDDLAAVARLVRLARATRTAIHRNLWLAGTYNLAAIPLAAGALAPALGWHPDPMWAAAAMAGSSLAVVGSSLLLRRVPLDQPSPGSRNS